MASSKSYHITVNNNLTEKEAIDFVLSQDPHLYNPTSQSRKALLKLFDLPTSFSRAFDLVYYPNANLNSDSLEFEDKESLIFIELKTTKKALPHNPRGFFFGATENEFKLAEMLGEQYKFCFVSLHPDTKSYAYKTLREMQKLIKNQRIQYQINLTN